MPRVLDADVVRNVQLRALQGEGRQRPFAKSHKGPETLLSRTVEWDVAGNCQSPVKVELHGRARPKLGERNIVVTAKDNRPNFVEIDAPCRKCENCLRRRAAHWRLRALAEYHSASRTWLATLTLSPASVSYYLDLTRYRLNKSGVSYEALSEHDRFIEFEGSVFSKRVKLANGDWVGGEFQAAMKRLRKNSGVPVRYLCVTEQHKSGLPHWHVLLYEQDPARPFSSDRDFRGKVWNAELKRYEQKEPFWRLGFAKYNLVADAKGAGYVCKYLSKSIGARVRASVRFGACPTPPPPKAEVHD